MNDTQKLARSSGWVLVQIDESTSIPDRRNSPSWKEFEVQKTREEERELLRDRANGHANHVREFEFLQEGNDDSSTALK